MDNEVIYCEDGDYRKYCNVCVKICVERFFKNHLKSQTHTNIIRKKTYLSKYDLPL